jgi:hypothetical protein
MMAMLLLMLLLVMMMKVLQPHCCYSRLRWGCLCHCHSLHEIRVRILFPCSYLKEEYFRPQDAELSGLSVKEQSPSLQSLPTQQPLQY